MNSPTTTKLPASCEVIFVKRKSEVTAIPENHPGLKATPPEAGGETGATYYRTRLLCKCRYPFNFRHGALVVTNNMVTHKIVRCKQCAKGVTQ